MMNNVDAAQVKELILAILDERKELEDERKERLEERYRASEIAIAKAQDALNTTLQGFPQEYAKNAQLDTFESTVTSQLDSIRETIGSIRSDHVQRREFDLIKEGITESSGRRSILLILVSISASIAIAVLSLFIADRASVSSQIDKLQEENHAQQIEVTRLQDQISTVLKK